MSFKDLDKINFAVIIASCQTQARVYAEKRWPNIDICITELERKYVNRLAAIDEILICVETINE